jgi:type I restriction enzyme M protein
MESNIEAVEKRLWTAADQLRANSDFASNEYFLPVMGLIFLRHAYSRYLAVKPEIHAGLPSRGGVTRPLTKEDFTSRGAIFLQPHAQFDFLASLPDGADRAAAIIVAMEAVEGDYAALAGVLPKTEYQQLENDVLGNVLRIFNDPALQNAKGDVFGRIYEYFLTQFADQSAHDGGEFFTPPSIVQMIVNAICACRRTADREPKFQIASPCRSQNWLKRGLTMTGTIVHCRTRSVGRPARPRPAKFSDQSSAGRLDHDQG